MHYNNWADCKIVGVEVEGNKGVKVIGELEGHSIRRIAKINTKLKMQDRNKYVETNYNLLYKWNSMTK